jgi:uncharacterized repeat protein (TIGR01451 family)
MSGERITKGSTAAHTRPLATARLAHAVLLGLIALLWCGLASAAITEVAATTAIGANGSTSALSLTVPAGTVINDVLLVQIAASNQTETITPPTGWTAIRSNSQTLLGAGMTQALFYRVATGTESASYSFSVSAATWVAGSMTTFRGVSTTAPIFGSNGQGGVLLLDTAPAVASCQAGAMQVFFFGFNTGALGLTIGVGLTPFATTTTNPVLGVTILNGGVTLASAGSCASNTTLAVSVTANIGQQVVLTPAPTQSVAGSVYGDTNHDSALSAGEAGIGQATFVKLASGSPGSCTSPALQVATADATTGAYSFAAVTAGSYCLITSTNSTLSDVAATAPSGFLRTETPSGIRSLTVAAANASAQTFGLYAGSTLAGTAFTDNGAGGGTANDGLINGTEAGIASVTVAAKSGATTITSATTDTNGAYTLWLPSSTSGSIAISETPLASAIAISGAVGTTAGTYARATNATTFTFAAGNTYTGVNFGNVAANTLSTTGGQSAGSNSTVPYPHTFVSGSVGSVTFSTSAASTPSAAWTQTITQDSNCNGVADAGEPVITGAIAVTAGQTVCVIVKDTMPAGGTNGAQDIVTLSATMVYTNASPAFSQAVTRTDTTTISSATLLQLTKQVRNVTQSTSFATSNNALPNDVLEYQVVATNPASGSVSSVVVGDTTPTFTTFVSASCPGSLPTGITGCTVTTQPAVGATGTMQWTFAGTLPAAGAVTVTYQVRVTQ